MTSTGSLLARPLGQAATVRQRLPTKPGVPPSWGGQSARSQPIAVPDAPHSATKPSLGVIPTPPRAAFPAPVQRWRYLGEETFTLFHETGG